MSLFVIYSGGAGVRTQGPSLARQALYHFFFFVLVGLGLEL
jgi:hypothetical protein